MVTADGEKTREDVRASLGQRIDISHAANVCRECLTWTPFGQFSHRSVICDVEFHGTTTGSGISRAGWDSGSEPPGVNLLPERPVPEDQCRGRRRLTMWRNSPRPGRSLGRISVGANGSLCDFGAESLRSRTRVEQFSTGQLSIGQRTTAEVVLKFLESA